MAEDLADGEPAPRRRPAPPVIDTSTAHPARVYDHWLGGKDNYHVDRKAGDAVARARPNIVRDVRENRGFMQRAAAHLAGQGVAQFLDIGSGIPTSPNLHEVAQAVNPASRVLYADNDPVVLAQSRALLASSPEGRTAYIHADMRDPAGILAHPDTRAVLDFTRPVAVFLVSVLWLAGDDEDPYGITATLMDAVPAGSFLVISHPASDIDVEVGARALRQYSRLIASAATLRNRAQVARFFDGLELVEPGVTQCHRWQSPAADAAGEYEVAAWAAAGRKPARPA